MSDSSRIERGWPSLSILLIGYVVSPLELIPGSSALISSDGGPAEKACSSADGSTGTHVTRGRPLPPFRRPLRRPGFHWRFGLVMFSDLVPSPLSADTVISHKDLKRLSRARHDRDGWSYRHCGTSAQDQDREEDEKTCFPVHVTSLLSLSGRSRNHPRPPTRAACLPITSLIKD
jgi:hypothetical protein